MSCLWALDNNCAKSRSKKIEPRPAFIWVLWSGKARIKPGLRIHRASTVMMDDITWIQRNPLMSFHFLGNPELHTRPAFDNIREAVVPDHHESKTCRIPSLTEMYTYIHSFLLVRNSNYSCPTRCYPPPRDENIDWLILVLFTQNVQFISHKSLNLEWRDETKASDLDWTRATYELYRRYI